MTDYELNIMSAKENDKIIYLKNAHSLNKIEKK